MEISGDLIVFSVSENREGEDLNGDGDTRDSVIGYFDIGSGNSGTIGQAVIPGNFWVSGSIVVYFFDTLRLYDIQTGVHTDTGIVPRLSAHNPASVSGNIVAYADSSKVVHLYNIDDGSTTSTGQIGEDPFISGAFVAFATEESWVGEDLNGNGSSNDRVIRVFDTASSRVITSPLVDCWAPEVGGNTLLYYCFESANNWDLTGDGDLYDIAVVWYDIASETFGSTNVEGWEIGVDDGLIAWSVSERSDSVGDRNGDGDSIDRLILFCNDFAADTGIAELEALVEELLLSGGIGNRGVGEALRAILRQAGASLENGQVPAAINQLQAFINLVTVQSGKHLTLAAAQELVSAGQSFVDTL